MKGLAFSAGMAADLTLVEDQGQGIGQKPDHGQHHQGRSLVDGGVFEVTVGGKGLKDFGIDSPTAATELMNEQGRVRNWWRRSWCSVATFPSCLWFEERLFR